MNASPERNFGLLFAAVFAVVGCWPVIAGHSPRVWYLAAAAISLAVALISPRLLTRPRLWWLRLGELIHRVTNPLILGAIFYLIITPIGIIMKLSGRDPLRLRKAAPGNSFWIAREKPSLTGDDFRNQF